MRLLIIEDEDRLSGILKSKLGDVGFTVDVVGSAADANAALELINYDAVVLDLGCPIMTASPSWRLRGGSERPCRS